MSSSQVAQVQGGPLRAFKHHNFRLFWCGQFLSLIGSWMQGLAQAWLILVLADPASATYVLHHGGDVSDAVNHATRAVQATANRYQGNITFLQGIPVFCLVLFAGVIIDRVNKRRLLMVTQIGLMLCALTTGFLIRFGLIQVYYVMIAAFVVGLLMAFDMPTRQSFVVEMVGKKDLQSAIGLNSSLFNSARTIGPALAGLLLASHISLAACFLGNGVAYVIVIACIASMRNTSASGRKLGEPIAKPKGQGETRLWDDLQAGFRYAWQNHTTRNVLILVGGLGTFAFSFNVLIPTFVRFTLLPFATNAEQVRAFGFLEAFRGIGALCAALMVVGLSRTNQYSRYKWNLIGGSLLSNGLLMVLAWERNMWAAYLTMAVVSGGFVMIFASANTVMQLTVPDNLRGRVMSIYTLVFMGTGPFGGLLAGHLAPYFGIPLTIFSFALVTVMIAVWASFRPGGLATIRVAMQPRASDPPPSDDSRWTASRAEPEPTKAGTDG